MMSVWGWANYDFCAKETEWCAVCTYTTFGTTRHCMCHCKNPANKDSTTELVSRTKKDGVFMMTIGCKDGCFYNHVGGERRKFAWDEKFSRGLAVPILCTTTAAEVDIKKWWISKFFGPVWFRNLEKNVESHVGCKNSWHGLIIVLPFNWRSECCDLHGHLKVGSE